MDWDDVYPGFTVGLVAALVIALKAVVDLGRLRAQFVLLTEKFAILDTRVLRLAERLDEAAPSLSEAASPSQVAPPSEPVAPAVMEPPASPAEPPTAHDETSAAPQEPFTIPEEPGVPAPPPPPPPPTLPGRGWEQLLVEHWLVWVGGAAMALGGAFLVKLSIDQGLLTPLVRVILGVLLGVGLSAAAEWVRRREPAEDAAAGGASYVPQALAAAGAATVFASLYAAHALYGFLPAGLAFPLLAATAGATVLQSLQYGPLVAALGLIGAFVVPLLVTSNAPQALPLFAYLSIVTAASLALLRFREWWWLAWPSLAGALLWEMLWLATPHAVESPVVAVYLLVQFGLFVAFRRGIPSVDFLAGIADTPMVRAVTRVAFWAIAYGLLALANADGFSDTSVGAAILVAIGLLGLAYRDSQLDDVIAVAGVLALALLASWNLPLPIPEMSLWVFKIETDHVADFSIAATLFTLILGGGGFAVLTRVAHPGRWAALSASVPLLVLVIAYWRLQKFELDVAWTLTALVLAGLELGRRLGGQAAQPRH